MQADAEALCDSVTIRSDERFGTTAFASKPFERGDVVLCEEPMLTFADLSSEQSDAASVLAAFADVAALGGLPVKFFEAVISIVLSCMDTAKVLAMEASLYAPPCALQSKIEKQAVALLLSSSDAQFGACFPAHCKSYTYWCQCRKFGEKGVARVLKLMHACRVNVHEAFGQGFVFDKASKLAHSCNANTFWVIHRAVSGQARVIHVALRAIREGEVLSFSYIGTGLNLLLPMLHRREQLADLNFQCVCSRCTAALPVDRSRMLQCPQCASHLVALHATRGQWTCSGCASAFWREEALSKMLFDERSLGTMIMRLFFGRANTDNDGHKLWQAVESSTISKAIWTEDNPLVQRWVACGCAADVLGSAHYLFASAYAGLVLAIVRGLADEEKCVTDVRLLLEYLRGLGRNGVKGVESYWTDTWMRWYADAREWFASNVPDSAQEARTFLLFGEALDGLLASVMLTVEEHDSLHTFRALLNDKKEHPLQRFGELTKFQEFRLLRDGGKI